MGLHRDYRNLIVWTGKLVAMLAVAGTANYLMADSPDRVDTVRGMVSGIFGFAIGSLPNVKGN